MNKMNVLMVGTGEYTTGFVSDAEVATDKKAGVVGTTLFDLRRRGLVGRLLMAGTNGTKFPAIRAHLQRAIAMTYREMDVAFDSFPADDIPRDPTAYLKAMAQLRPGDAVIIFTPDDTHFEIALAAIEQGCHVLIAKPIVKTVCDHLKLIDAAAQKHVVVAMEVHKRWDPIYVDARDRIRTLGDFSFFQSYMSQPKSQLATFQAWAGKSSDISYYLNSHHVDFNPLFMKYTPDANGFFAGQSGYGYRSIEAFLLAAEAVRCGSAEPNDFNGKLATAQDTLLVTAILEAGRRSLDDQGRTLNIDYTSDGKVAGLR
jgi:D-galacturonate reductase